MTKDKEGLKNQLKIRFTILKICFKVNIEKNLHFFIGKLKMKGDNFEVNFLLNCKKGQLIPCGRF